jgi:hypothetical protein
MRGRAFADHALRLDLGPQAAPPLARALLPSDALFEGPGAMPAVPVPHFSGLRALFEGVPEALGW